MEKIKPILKPSPEIMCAIELDFMERKTKKYIIEKHGLSCYMLKKLFPQQFTKVNKNRGQSRYWNVR